MKEQTQLILLASVILCLYLGFLVNKQAQETNTSVLDILKDKKEICCLTIVGAVGLIYLTSQGDEGLNLFGQDKICTTDFYEQP
jgi:hypothetical protein